jgi:hypothetical protein
MSAENGFHRESSAANEVRLFEGRILLLKEQINYKERLDLAIEQIHEKFPALHSEQLQVIKEAMMSRVDALVMMNVKFEQGQVVPKELPKLLYISGDGLSDHFFGAMIPKKEELGKPKPRITEGEGDRELLEGCRKEVVALTYILSAFIVRESGSTVTTALMISQAAINHVFPKTGYLLEG